MDDNLTPSSWSSLPGSLFGTDRTRSLPISTTEVRKWMTVLRRRFQESRELKRLAEDEYLLSPSCDETQPVWIQLVEPSRLDRLGCIDTRSRRITLNQAALSHEVLAEEVVHQQLDLLSSPILDVTSIPFVQMIRSFDRIQLLKEADASSLMDHLRDRREIDTFGFADILQCVRQSGIDASLVERIGRYTRSASRLFPGMAPQTGDLSIDFVCFTMAIYLDRWSRPGDVLAILAIGLELDPCAPSISESVPIALERYFEAAPAQGAPSPDPKHFSSLVACLLKGKSSSTFPGSRYLMGRLLGCDLVPLADRGRIRNWFMMRGEVGPQKRTLTVPDRALADDLLDHLAELEIGSPARDS